MENNHKFAIYLILTIIIIIELSWICVGMGLIPLYPHPQDIEGKNYTGTIDFYAYGDSITRANTTFTSISEIPLVLGYYITLSKTTRDLPQDGSGSYINQMVKYHDPNATVFHNMMTGCKSTKCAYDGLGTVYNKNTKYFVYMFATNDNYYGMTINDTIGNYTKIYDYISRNGTIPVPCIPPLSNDTSVFPISEQIERIHAMESAFDSRGIFYVKMYDVFDSIPYNGKVDDISICYQPDSTHPNLQGQKMMGDYLWNKLSEKYNLTNINAG